ncbi:MAG: MFS transporter [Pseudomonadales bacterium]
MAATGIRAGLGLMRRPDVAKLCIAFLISYLGTAMTPIALAFGVLELTGSTSESAIVIAASTAGQITILLVGGTLADRTSRHRIIVGADTLALFSQSAMAALFIFDQASVPLLAGLMLVTGVAYALHQPAITGLIPQIVERHELQAINALLGAARNSSITLGAALAGILVATVGAGVTILIDAISFGISALLIATLKPRAQKAPEAAPFLRDLKLGWSEFTRHKWLWTIVVQFSIVVAALDAVFGLLGPAVAREQLGGSVSWGIIAAGMGVGTLVGGLIALRIQVRYPMFLASLMVLLFAIAPLALAVPLSVPLATFGFLISGAAGEIFGVLWYTTLQKEVPPHLLSRVSAYDHLGSIGIAPLGIVAAGFLYEAIGPRPTLLICAACVIVPTLLVLCVKEVRKLEPVI